jgi:L-ascorbate metabolism protein UlaG (beta-lactamase superfamily)
LEGAAVDEGMKVFLRPNVMVEPLIDQWYAWAHLVSPATAAMNVVGRHLAIMESYVRAPQVHVAAVQNPKMLGGPFVDYDRVRVDEIRALIERTRRDRAPMIAFAEAVKELDGLLADEASGYSLEPLYAKVPERLRGFVELTYDLNNHATFRLVEPLLYRSEYYDPSAQTLMLSLIDRDDRPFILSTPRLADDGDVQLRIPFAHAGVDELFRAKQEARPFAAMRDLLEVEDRQLDGFRRLFTADPPARYAAYEGQGVRWRYLGHACILVEANGVSILLDPVLSYTYDSGVSRYTYEDLPDRIDYALITHNHQDHILFETILQLRHKIGAVVVPRSGGGALQDPSLKLLLRAIGFPNVIEMEELGTIELAGGAITGIPFFGEHGDLDVRSKMAYLVRLGRHSLLFAADSCNIDPVLYERVHALTGDVDVLFVGMECDGAPMSWVYGPLLTRPLERKMDQSRRLAGSNHARASDMVRRFNCREVYVYAMGQEPWLNYIMSVKYTPESNPIVASDALLAECRSRGLAAERLFGEKEILLP